MTEEEDGSSFGAELLLDTLVKLELDSALDDDFAEEEDSRFSELNDALDSFSSFEDEDFTFSLLDELGSTEEEDSTPGSSFGPADADDESSHAAKNATMLSATKIFFINSPSPQRLNLSCGNIIFPNQLVLEGQLYLSNFQPQSLW